MGREPPSTRQGPKLAHCTHLFAHCNGVFRWVKGNTEKYGVPRLSFLTALQPASYLREAAKGYMRRVADPLPKPFVTVHLRTFQESIRCVRRETLRAPSLYVKGLSLCPFRDPFP
jgi:hypothetical protein